MEGPGVRAAKVDDRDLVEVVGLVDGAAGVCPLEPDEVRADALAGIDVAVDVGATQVAVEIHELLRRQQPLSQALKAELDAGVVERAVGESVAGPSPEQVHHVVLEGAAHAVGIGLALVHLGGRDVRAAARRHPRVRNHGRERDRVARVRVVDHRADLGRGPGVARIPARRILEVLQQHVVVLVLHRRGPSVGEAALRRDALVDAGERVGHLLLHQ